MRVIFRSLQRSPPIAFAAVLCAIPMALAQAPVKHAPIAPEAAQAESSPIAIVPFDPRDPENGVKVSGALEVANGKAILVASGEIASGNATTQVTLPRRGTLRICASTTVKLAADSSVASSAASGDMPGLMMAMDHGAIEASYATGRNADVLMTPDFRILIGGAGAAGGAVEVKVRLGDHGDTCVDNPGVDAPYVLVSSVFDGGAYRVQPGQRVMFQHGSLQEVVDNEKEPCGCPPVPSATGNEFPLAQSEGLAPLPRLPAAPGPTVGLEPQSAPPLVHNSESTQPMTGSIPESPAPSSPAQQSAPAAAQPAQPAKKPGFFHRIGNFFRRIFGAE